MHPRKKIYLHFLELFGTLLNPMQEKHEDRIALCGYKLYPEFVQSSASQLQAKCQLMMKSLSVGYGTINYMPDTRQISGSYCQVNLIIYLYFMNITSSEPFSMDINYILFGRTNRLFI